MLAYIITLIVYLLSFPSFYFLTGNLTLSILAKLVLAGVCLFIYKKSFKFRIKFDWFAVVIGIVIFMQWVLLDNLYPHLGSDIIYNYSSVDIMLKFLTGVVLAPVIEEFFTRFFLMRWIIDKNWEKVALGKYTFMSFLITVLFFGFSHNRWLAGIITGILLNILLYKRKNIESCILAHSAANLLLGIYVVYRGAFYFW
ncbi:CAAX prenyl protease-related protein [Candidatus Woesearchaeota archaeon]|nr:CAAX prenyl protease-related protein [Candidatus Woesearchaeota archaeon]